MRLRKRLAALGVALLAPLGLLAFSSSTPAGAATTDVCYYQSWGPGWFKTGSHRDPNMCGGSNGIDNVFTLTSWYDVQLGGTMVICQDQPVSPPFPSADFAVTGSVQSSSCGQSGISLAVRRVGLGRPQINAGGVVSFAADGRFHLGNVVAVYGIDFYPTDVVTFTQGTVTVSVFPVWDDVDLRGQINVQIPSALQAQPTYLTVTNLAGNTSDAYFLNLTA